jgi:CheY-like chemotaxis protein
LERILINLLVNAREALQEEGGRVVVCVERAPDGWARMVVRDDGPGLDPSIAGTALDSRVTTKPGGAGLGLRSVTGIVEAAGGRIRLDSASGEGTRVAIELPPVLATVMVVEDVEVVGRQARRILEDAGYAVVAARDAESALGRLDGVDVLVTDVSMPGMSGTELARVALDGDRDLRVVFMSGRAQDAVGGGEGTGFVAKPFTAASLCDAVAGALAG